jgi:pilus assembly protein Flp/PilA
LATCLVRIGTFGPPPSITPARSDAVENAMNNLLDRMRAMLDAPDRGAAAAEYGLLVTLIAVMIVTAITLLGSEFLAVFGTLAGWL